MKELKLQLKLKLVSSNEVLDIQATRVYRFTLKPVRDMIITDSQPYGYAPTTQLNHLAGLA